MRVCSLVSERCILTEVSSGDKWDFLRLVSRLFAEETGLKAEVIEEALFERERMGSTAMGEGVALPHARVPLLTRMYIGLARCLRGMEFEAPDNQPVRIIFTVLAPEEETSAYLRCLSQLARMLKEKAFREAILAARNKQEIIEVVARFDREF